MPWKDGTFLFVPQQQTPQVVWIDDSSTFSHLQPFSQEVWDCKKEKENGNKTFKFQQMQLLSRCLQLFVRASQDVGAAWRSWFAVFGDTSVSVRAWPCSPESDLVTWGASSQLRAHFKAGKEARFQTGAAERGAVHAGCRACALVPQDSCHQLEGSLFHEVNNSDSVHI